MATALLEKLDDITECSICCDAYKDPRQLPCLHSFCLKCLEGYRSGKVLSTVISCPLCRKETKLPCGGIQGFPKNFFIEKIMEIKRLSGPVTEGTKCDVCWEGEEKVDSSRDVPVAEMYCTNCHYNLCSRCTNEHKKHMKSHCIVGLGCDKVVEQLAKSLATNHCSSHPQDAVRMFCRDCRVVICFLCFAEEHQTHKCSDINKEAEIMRKQIESDIKGVSNCLSALQQSVTNMGEKRSNFLDQIDIVEKDILKKSNHLKEIVDRDTDALLTELEFIKSSQLKDICTKTEELDRGVTILNSFKTYGEEIIALGCASEICRSFHQFHDRNEEIIGNFRDPPFQEFSPRKLTLKTTGINDVQQQNLVGRIEDLSCRTEDDRDGVRILFSINFRENLGRLKEMLLRSRATEEIKEKWKDVPFEFKQKPEVDENLFVLSIYTLIDNFAMAEYNVPDGIGVNNLAAVLTGPAMTDELQMIVFERGKRVLKLIGSEAQVEETKRSIELMTGTNLLSDSLSECCNTTNDTNETKKRKDTNYRRIENDGPTHSWRDANKRDNRIVAINRGSWRDYEANDRGSWRVANEKDDRIQATNKGSWRNDEANNRRSWRNDGANNRGNWRNDEANNRGSWRVANERYDRTAAANNRGGLGVAKDKRPECNTQ